MPRQILKLALITFLLLIATAPATAQSDPLAKPVVTIEVFHYVDPVNHQIDIRWDAIEGAERYILYQWTQENGFERLDTDDLTGTSYSVFGLSVGVTYYFTLKAIAQGRQDSAWSDYVHATPTPIATPTPTPTQTVATPTPTPTVAPSEKCAIASYSSGQERYPSVHVPLIHDSTLTSYRSTFGVNLVDLDIVAVSVHPNGNIEIWYQGEGQDSRNFRRVSEIFNGCQFIGHTEWQTISYR